ncbi:copper resistance protein CopC [Phycicoccus endophyticus]|uniref:Copper resistance protein CopC n=1 Tax=Phycicoccus endophyticus TaxID=1690220 RepID=A0A7G9R3B5_9MICO|nr:copper resistance CopC family protein [Phycicoccus endophyticus]NHI19837.1 copper resistance protein CopC [Phycicoccus endophyticus]QNN50090.1 copper resistance protein CopC [Phycicoccus endophyticus]GGL28178.1 hypothetical protein GCM10012283_08000 [Phycicoccus endophyticus]
MFSRRTSTVVTLVVVALVAVALVASALPVFAAPAAALPAHAQLVSTDPEDGASVGTLEQVTLTFSEEVNDRFLQVRVEGPDGDETDGAPRVEGTSVEQQLVTDLPAGEHTVTYRVVSVDGHPVSGSLSFTTTEAPARPSGTPSSSPTSSPATTSASPSPSSSSEPPSASASSEPGWLVPALGVLVLLLLVAGVALALHRRRSARG